MIYEWKCRKCSEIVEVQRPKELWNVPPQPSEVSGEHDWFRYIGKPPSVPFEHLKNAGIFPNQYGDIPPRKMD